MILILYRFREVSFLSLYSPFPQITTHPNPDIETCLIPRKTVSSLHTQPEPLSLCPLSDEHRARFTVHLDTIQLCTVSRHVGCIKAVFVDFLRNRQYTVSRTVSIRFVMIVSLTTSPGTRSTLAGRNTINRIRTAIMI